MDNLTYTDLSGKRRLRNYVKAAIVILALMLVVYAYAAWQRSQFLADVTDGPQPLDPALIPPTATVVALAPTATPEACPTNPDDWKLVEVIPNDNFRRIEPACVYAGLERAVAWQLATSMGYTRAEANQALGFDKMPASPFGLPQDENGYYMNVLTNQKGPLALGVNVDSQHPNYASWAIDSAEKPMAAAQLRGCFRTRSMTGGNLIEEWGNGYPVVCVLAVDGWWFSHLRIGEFGWTNNLEPSMMRSFYYYGYGGNGEWISVGRARDLSVELDPATLADEYKLFSQFYQTPLWDADWLAATYGLTMRPLPENWKDYTDVAGRDEILKLVNQWSTAEYKKFMAAKGNAIP